MSVTEKINVNPIEVYRDEYISLHMIEGTRVALCIAESEYIPIEEFKLAFIEIGKIIRENNSLALIFDKRNLNTFHQPSMEWYYTAWKAEMLEQGLTKHYKILPPMRWFAKSVEAGKRDIKRNHPSFDFDVFSVTYVDSIAEALKDYKSSNASIQS